MTEPFTSLLVPAKAGGSVLKHVVDLRARRALIRPGLSAPYTKGGNRGPATMFHDPWSYELKVSIATDVQEPRRLELEQAFIRFETAGDKLRWSSDAYSYTPYVNARKEFVLVFPMSTVHMPNVAPLDAHLFVRYAEEVRAKNKSRYVSMKCESGKPVQMDSKHLVPVWRVRRAGMGSWVRHGIAAFT